MVVAGTAVHAVAERIAHLTTKAP